MSAPADTSAEDAGLLSIPHIPLTISLSLHEGYDDNFRTSQSSQASWFTNGGASLLYNLPGVATHVVLHAGADVTYYTDATSGQTDNINSYISGSFIHDVSKRLKLDAEVYATYRTEPDFGANVGTDIRSGDFFHTLDSITATYHWTRRIATATSDKFQLVDYQSNSASFLNRFENTAGEEFRYDLFHAGNTIALEYRFKVVDYDTAPRDSITHFALLGFDQEFTPYLKLILRGGETFRSYSQGGSDQMNPQVEGTLTYEGAHHSSLSWRTTYGVEEPSSADILTRTTFRTGLELKYNFTARISGAATVFYHHDDNKGSSATTTTGGVMPMGGFTEDSVDGSLSLKYTMSHRFSFDVGFQHSEISSGRSSRDYSRDRYFAGLTFTY